VGTNGDIYIDNGKSYNRVDKWTLNATSGEAVMNVSDSCSGLFIDLNNTIYCSIENNHQVVKKSLNSIGTLTSVAAGTGISGNGSFMLNGPRGIFADKQFNLYVADRYNQRIQRFSFGQLNGTTVVGSAVPGTISLNQPTGVVLDGDDYLFIVDSSNNRIVGQGANGYRCVVGCSTSGGTQLNSARTLSFDTFGNMFVTDKYNNQVDIFLLSNNDCSKFIQS